jgi:hypothetical protein
MSKLTRSHRELKDGYTLSLFPSLPNHEERLCFEAQSHNASATGRVSELPMMQD